MCGKLFTFSQELSRHVRDKQCEFKITTTQSSFQVQEISYHTMQILPTYTIIVPTQSITSCQSTSTTGTTTTDVILSVPSAHIVDSGLKANVSPEKISIENANKLKTDTWRCSQCDFT